MMFLISIILLVLVLVTKLSFTFFTSGSSVGVISIITIVLLILIILVGIFDYFKNRNTVLKMKSFNKKGRLIDYILIAVSAIVILTSVIININKKAVLWDAVALYDARAKFLIQDVNFFEMVNLSKYDPQNSYYYVLYPPYTSVIHYYWYSLGVSVPVGVFYSILFFFLAVVVFTFTKKRVGNFLAALLTLLVVSNGVIFSSSLAEYTNLPFSLQMLLGIFLLYEYLNDDKKWKLFYGIGLVINTMWIRFLEPLWVGALLAMLIAIFLKKRFSKDLFYPALAGIYGVLEYVSWQGFVSGFGEATKIVSFSAAKIFELVIGVFTGSAISIMLFFVKSWGPILLVYIFAISLAAINKKRISFLQIFLLSSIIIYFSGLYFVSFQSVWWKALGDSLLRSSTFMVPIGGYIILEYLHGKKN